MNKEETTPINTTLAGDLICSPVLLHTTIILKETLYLFPACHSTVFPMHESIHLPLEEEAVMKPKVFNREYYEIQVFKW